MIVISVEGNAFYDRGTWTTHKILGVFKTQEEVDASNVLDVVSDDDECAILSTNTETGEVKRISTLAVIKGQNG